MSWRVPVVVHRSWFTGPGSSGTIILPGQGPRSWWGSRDTPEARKSEDTGSEGADVWLNPCDLTRKDAHSVGSRLNVTVEWRRSVRAKGVAQAVRGFASLYLPMC